MSYQFFFALIAIFNPFAMAPIFLATFDHQRQQVVNILAFMITLSVLAFVIFFVMTGDFILRLFSISLPAFQISGGLLLLIRAINMMNGSQPHIDALEEQEASGWFSSYKKAREIFPTIFVPIVVPMFVGPGTITTAILFGNQAATMHSKTLLIAEASLACLVIVISLWLSETIKDKVNQNVIQVSIRLFGLILGAIGVQFMINGVTQVIASGEFL